MMKFQNGPYVGAAFVPAAGVIRFADVKVARRYSVCKPTYT
jgi:hypothetical protein